MAGFVVRAVAWWGGGSLNSDELYIAVNIQQLGFYQLAGSVLYDQISPLGWLWLMKVLYVLGAGDAALRLPALLAGWAGVVLSAVLARRLLPAPYAVAATALVAGNPTLIYQSVQVKPYTIEAAVVVLLVLLALRIRPDRADTDRAVTDRAVTGSAVRRFWFTGAVAVWFATTAIFVLCAVGGLLVLFAAGQRRWPVVRTHLSAALAAIASVVVVRLLAAPVADWVYRFWSTTYPYSLGPRRLSPRTVLSWSGEVWIGFTTSSLGVWARPWVVPVLLLMVAGAAALWLRHARVAALVCAPLVMAYLLALLRLYPLGTRAGTWLVPLSLIVACGVGAAGHAPVRRLRALAPVRAIRRRVGRVTAQVLVSGAVAVILVGGFGSSWGRTPAESNATRYAVAEHAVAHIADRQRAGDVVLFQRGAAPIALWYAPAHDLRWHGSFHVATRSGCRADAGTDHTHARLASATRLWLVTRAWGPDKRRTLADLAAATVPYGRQVSRHWYGSVVVTLYQAAPRPGPASHCLIVRPATAPA